MAHEEQGDCSLTEDTSLEVQNSPLNPENKDGTAEVEGGTVAVVTRDTSGEDIANHSLHFHLPNFAAFKQEEDETLYATFNEPQLTIPRKWPK